MCAYSRQHIDVSTAVPLAAIQHTMSFLSATCQAFDTNGGKKKKQRGKKNANNWENEYFSGIMATRSILLLPGLRIVHLIRSSICVTATRNYLFL